MSTFELNRFEFRDLAVEILGNEHRIRFQACGESMQPFIQNNDILNVAPLAGKQIECGDVLLIETGEGRLLVHRVVKSGFREGNPVYLIKCDNNPSPDGWFRLENVLGRVEVVERGCQRILLTSPAHQRKTRVWVMISPWVSKMSWLPKQLRQRVRDWLLVS